MIDYNEIYQEELLALQESLNIIKHQNIDLASNYNDILYQNQNLKSKIKTLEKDIQGMEIKASKYKKERNLAILGIIVIFTTVIIAL